MNEFINATLLHAGLPHVCARGCVRQGESQQSLRFANLSPLHCPCACAAGVVTTTPLEIILLERQLMTVAEGCCCCLHAQFVEKAAAKAKSLKVGDTMDPSTQIGAQVRIPAFRTVADCPDLNAAACKTSRVLFFLVPRVASAQLHEQWTER